MKRNILTYLFLGFIFCFIANTAGFAQGGYQCGTTQMHKKLLANHPELVQVEADYNALISQQMNSRDADSNHIYIIPIVFHILHTNGAENISDAQVLDEVNILNRDFRKLNADTSAIIPPFQGLAADSRIEFRLAQIDPNGNCTNGIDRIYSHKTENANDESKLNPWPREKYLNVWVIKTMESVGTAGYAYYPSGSAPWYMEPFDGIIIINSYIGSIGTASVGTSRALTHEVGHWLNLPHTWGSTNNPEVGCGDEGVTDTPQTAGHNTCSNRYDYECDSKALSATFSFGSVTTSSGTTDPSAAPEASDSSITFTNPTAVGVSANSASAGMFEFSDWDTGSAAINGDTTYALMTGAINTGKYYEFTISPDLLPEALTLSSVSFTVQRDTNGIRSFSVRSSGDSYANNLAASITPANPNLNKRGTNTFFIKYDTTTSLVGSRITLSGAAFTSINNASRTFRIYGWNAEDSTGTFGVDNITVTGTHGIIENVENYMEYSYCSKMYTKDQKTRMRSALENALSARDNLWINANLLATGTDGTPSTCAPVADFYANRTSICPGNNITFTKNVMNIAAVFGTTYTSIATTYNWQFPGGSTTTFSGATPPAITYSTPGSYDVTLTVTNANGTHSITKTNFIYVSNSAAQVTNTYSEDFENSTQYYTNWFSKDLDNNLKTWWYNSIAGYSGTHSVMMNAYYNYAFDVDQLFSPSYNLTFITSPVLTFRLAGASKATTAADMNDKLYVYSSIDCGASWNLKKSITGVTLNNNSYHPEEFVPTSPSQWSLISVTGLPTGPNVRFKFEYTSGHEGNTIYIDDVNMTGVLGINDQTLIDANVSIYPNPTSETATISYTLGKKGDVTITLVDVLGKKVMESTNLGQIEGDYNFEISKQNLNLKNGVYIVKFSIDNTSMTKKLVISE